ncbi:hypothetical protein BGX26_000800 [Mortierella sp. AD094]|nr:hypothetical protein BGX26_000800 [Mortierella sp. AD094]
MLENDSDEDEDVDPAILEVILHHGIGLNTFRAYNPDDGGYGNILETLIELHSDTLEDIELIDCVMVQSRNLRPLFTMCKNLRRFWATPENEGIIELSFSDIVREEWVCLEMRELRLNLIPSDPYDIPHSATYIAASMAKKVYAQIGRLVKLEKLSLRYDSDGSIALGIKDFKKDLTLEQGWLAELAGLSRLRHFHMVTDFWSNMGKAEVEFMHANWTHLERITFGEDDTMAEPSIRTQPHWRWLRINTFWYYFRYDFLFYGRP